MVNQDGSRLERVIEGQQDLIRQGGRLIEQALELERVRIEAEQAKASHQTSTATQIISAPQTPVSGGYAVRDTFRPLEALVLQGPAFVGGVEVFGAKVLTLISSAVKQIYPDLGVDKWELRDDGGWSNDKLYVCINCNAVQRRDNREVLTTPTEYTLIQEAFRSGNILLNQDTSSCSGKIIEGAKGEAYKATLPKDVDVYAAKQRLEEITALKKSIGGEWYPTKTDGTGDWWNSLYLFCQASQRAYSRQTGEEFKSPYVRKIFEIIVLSPFENLCPAQPGYKSLMGGYVLPEAARIRAPINCQGHK